MKIHVDARLLRGGGIGRYIREITGGWLENSQVESVHFLGRPAELEPWLAEVDSRGISRLTPWSDGPYSPGAQLRWPGLRAGIRQGVLFFPHFDVPLGRLPVPVVVTIHDLIHFQMPGAFPAWKRRLGGMLLNRAVARARRVITISQSTRSDLLARIPEVEDRLRVIPNGVTRSFLEPDPERLRKKGLLLDRYRPYLLAVGALKAHKNLPLALEVLARIRGHHPELRLLVAAPHDPEGKRVLLRQARERRVADRVEVLGPLDDGDLQALYSGAEVLLFPSFYEGFGLPPLEAMALGTPVLASDRSSVPEVVGDAAPCLDPTDPEAWVAPLRDLLETEGRRAEWSARGRARAREFSWERAAQETLGVLQEAAEVNP
ncbi:MAG: glycosyltransferase family 1 protein [Gemmatimonadota bacterium]